MRTDVKVFLICLGVVVLFVGVYVAVTHHSSSKRIKAQNVLPSPQPALTPTPASVPPAENTATNSGAGTGNGTAGNGPVAQTTPMQPAGIVPPASPTTAPFASGANVPPTTMSGAFNAGGQITMNTSPTNNADNGTGGSLKASSGSGASGGPGAGGGNGNTTGETGNAQMNATGGINGNSIEGDHTAGEGGGTIAGSGMAAGAVSGRTYTVRHGDTLTGIAHRIYGTSRMVLAIERANPGVDPRRLRIGEKIHLPGRHHGSVVRAFSRHRHHPYHGAGRIYIVRRGDTLMRIARREYHRAADWKLIYRANRRIIGARPADLRPGERLVLPQR